MIDPQAMLAEFTELVTTPSLSYQEAAVADLVEGKLRDLGLSTQRDHAHEPLGGQTGNVIGKLPATDAALPTIMLNAHLDTVGPGCGIQVQCNGDQICSGGDTILGADDKAGVTAIFAALRELISSDLPHGELQVVFTIAEEVGLYGARHLDYSLLSPAYALVFDGSRTIGTLTVAAPSASKMTWRVRGRAAHAGVAPERGINAIQVAAQAIAAMKIGRLDHETTANVGIISGGTARNIVPELCELKGEARSHDEAKLQAQIEQLRQCLQEAVAAVPGAQLEEEIEASYRSFHLSETEPVVRLATAAAERLGLPVKYEIGGGGSDANIFNERGIPALICATGACDPHTLTETCSLSAMVQSAQWLVEMIALSAQPA